MKNLFAFIITLTILGFFTSCSEDDGLLNDESTELSIDQNDSATGEEVAQLFSFAVGELDSEKNEEELQLRSEKTVSLFSEKMKTTSLSKSRSISWIDCGDIKEGTTAGETNSFLYGGSDKGYSFELDRDAIVEVNLFSLSSDLDLYILDDQGNILGASYNSYSQDESISLELNDGDYYIVVETYDVESDFVLTISCESTPPPTECEDYEDMRASTYTKISRESDLWNLWRNYKSDGRVLYEDYNYNNKVVKFDARRFGNQDVVRDLKKSSTLASGIHHIGFDIWVDDNGVANFLTEKTGSYGQEQGFIVKIDDGAVSINHKGRTYNSRTDMYTGTWNRIDLLFDMDREVAYLVINWTSQVVMDTEATRTRSYGRNSIRGINFYNSSNRSKFHIDNVCVTELDDYDRHNPFGFICGLPLANTNNESYRVLDSNQSPSETMDLR